MQGHATALIVVSLVNTSSCCKLTCYAAYIAYAPENTAEYVILQLGPLQML